jgi:hypothetical protein
MGTLGTRLFMLVSLASTALVSASAPAEESKDGYEELKSGYDLKQQGDCRQAIVHFMRSVRIYPTPKAFLNISDCEQRLGDWVSAKEHARIGQKLALDLHDGELAGVAATQIEAIDKKLAWLVIRLAGTAPLDCVVRRDEVLVDPAALGVALPMNPGPHSVSAGAAHRATTRFALTLAEGERAVLDVAPGAEDPRTDDPRGMVKVGVYATLGAGVVGLAVGVSTGVAAASKHAALSAECDSSGLCPDSARSDLDEFRALRTWSAVGYVVGAVGLVGGAALWFALPRLLPASSGPRAWIGPGGAGVAGSF